MKTTIKGKFNLDGSLVTKKNPDYTLYVYIANDYKSLYVKTYGYKAGLTKRY